MKRCPRCNSEMIIIDTHKIEVKYKIVNGCRSKNPIVEKYSENNKLSSRVVCQNCQYTEW
jgi:ribosomal protein S27AE